MFAAGPVKEEDDGSAGTKGIALGVFHASGSEGFAVGTEGEAADAADIGNEIFQSRVENLGIEFADGFPRANAPLAYAAEEVAADKVFAFVRNGEAKDALGVAL